MKQVIRGRWLWDGDSAAPIENGIVVVEDDRIAGVGREGDVEVPEHATVIDRGDEFLMPGMIDAHTHITIVPAWGDQTGQQRQPIEIQALVGSANMRRDLHSGVTTARIMSEERWLDRTFKREIDRGTIDGPRLITATRAITPSNGHGRALSAFDGVDEVRKGARENLDHGADFLKVFLTGGASSTRGNFDACSYSLDELRAIVEEADRAGTYVAAHALGGAGLSMAIEEGVRTLEHATLITDEQLHHSKEAGSWLVLTQAILMHPLGIEGGEDSNHEFMRRLKGIREQASERFQAIVGSGVKYTVGTDSVHGLLSYEVAQLVRWGASTLDALRAVTIRAAECCEVVDDVGTLAAGKKADVISVSGNPLHDISVLENVSMIMKNGSLVRSSS